MVAGDLGCRGSGVLGYWGAQAHGWGLYGRDLDGKVIEPEAYDPPGGPR
jgi:hypothetical protein